MTKKLFLSVIASFALMLAPLAQAQNTLTFGTTVTANVTNGIDYFYILLTGNVTTFSFSFGNEGAKPVLVTLIVQQDATGSRTIGWATNVCSTPTLTSTANKYTFIQFQYDTASACWYNTATTHN